MSKHAPFIAGLIVLALTFLVIVPPTAYVVVMLGDEHHTRELLRDLGFWSAMVYALNLAGPGILAVALWQWCIRALTKWLAARTSDAGDRRPSRTV